MDKQIVERMQIAVSAHQQRGKTTSMYEECFAKSCAECSRVEGVGDAACAFPMSCGVRTRRVSLQITEFACTIRANDGLLALSGLSVLLAGTYSARDESYDNVWH